MASFQNYQFEIFLSIMSLYKSTKIKLLRNLMHILRTVGSQIFLRYKTSRESVEAFLEPDKSVPA